jgi:predicted signal transduction protein with EAL and GGDEF domain
VANEIRSRVEESVFVSDDGRQVRVTLSIGVAMFPRDAGDFASLKKQADRAAYLAKRLGKNRVCLYQDRQEQIGSQDLTTHNEQDAPNAQVAPVEPTTDRFVTGAVVQVHEP